MYMTVPETAVFLSMPEEQVNRYVLEGRIRAVHDGEQYLINTSQFESHFKQLEIAKLELEEWRATPIPDDIDIKDED
ncbi:MULTISPECIES: excisionase family DNA-binding protein [Planococcus]|uniref:Excisionase family DNA binding protein n=1 Tax=Planococcus citreus TaxID=1373 RepID=A0A497YRK4_9BACL|nr:MULTISPECIES: excisionase family DNA-binding protein [Planococcus]AUD14713.1 DNA-binding protein [Planococcus sp. MB-3u-03]MDE0581781.1 excisionase family DNA-binding protein [Planococcus sp. A6]PKG45019.1 DNA-binding protein [Planococcus sp. Urea-trap-24]PKG87362.1 DNA-binding protein [Planococcus sp. Urea-3u-39]PKH42487.1 DNA-binding protein [Planococcus sp. MB-3u-09]